MHLCQAGLSGLVHLVVQACTALGGGVDGSQVQREQSELLKTRARSGRAARQETAARGGVPCRAPTLLFRCPGVSLVLFEMSAITCMVV